MKNKKLFLEKKVYNYFMVNGKKSLCEKLFLESFKLVQKNITKNHKDITKLAIINVTPSIKIKQIKKKKRKTMKELPFILNQKNRIALAIKSIVILLKKPSSLKSQNKFSTELFLSAQNQSELLKIKKDNHKDTFMKKKYIHFRWFC